MKKEIDNKDEFVKAFSCVTGVPVTKVKRWELMIAEFKDLIVEIQRFKYKLGEKSDSFSDEEKNDLLMFPFYAYMLGFRHETRQYMLYRAIKELELDKLKKDDTVTVIADNLKKFVSEEKMKDYVRNMFGVGVDGLYEKD